MRAAVVVCWLAERKAGYQVTASGQEVGTAKFVPLAWALLELT